jgi:hypothetical protein
VVLSGERVEEKENKMEIAIVGLIVVLLVQLHMMRLHRKVVESIMKLKRNIIVFRLSNGFFWRQTDNELAAVRDDVEELWDLV